MEPVQVEPDELHRAAARWDELASQLTHESSASGQSGQGSVAAVNAIHGHTTSTMAAFAERIRATATKTSEAASAFTKADTV